MGIMVQGKGVWNALFTRTQRQVLSLLFGYPDRSFYANEVVRLAAVGTGSVQRELARLSEAGLLTVSKVGNQKHYQANEDSPIYEELHRIVLKTFGAMDLIRTAIAALPGTVRLAFLHGEHFNELNKQDHDLNLALVSDELEYVDVLAELTELENRLGRNVHVRVFSSADIEPSNINSSGEITLLMKQPRVMLLGQLPSD